MARVSTIFDGERVYPFEPPSQRAWARIVRRVRTSFPLDFPVRITRSEVAPDGAMHHSGDVVLWHDDGTPRRARVWVNARLHRAAAIDALLHEWAHLMSEDERKTPDGPDLPHDDAFWITFGQLYRAWLREP